MNRKLIPLIVVLVGLGTTLTILCATAFQDEAAPLWIGVVLGLSGAGTFLAALWVLTVAQEVGEDDGK